MKRPRRVVLREEDLSSATDAHSILAERLEFPDYYGANFDALEDCLGDVREPTRVVLVRDPEEPKHWFDMLEQVVRDSAQRSCYLGCTIR